MVIESVNAPHATAGLRRSRTVFFGTPDFAVPSLRALVASALVEVTGVVTQPDRPAGRGRRLQPPPVKTYAEKLGIPILQVPTLRHQESKSWLRDRSSDLFVVAAFGLILGRQTLAIPRLGALNVHASLLPRYRGASPIAAAIAMGDQVTGVSLMQMDTGLDTGPVFARQAVDISSDDTTATLSHRLADLGALLLVEALPRILDGTLRATPQAGVATLTRPLVKEDGRIDWDRPAQVIVDQVRAMLPWPRAFTTLADGTLLQIHRVKVAVEVPGETKAPGTAHAIGGRLIVSCGPGLLEIEAAQLPGARATSGQQLLQRRAIAHGDRLGTHGETNRPPPLVVEING